MRSAIFFIGLALVYTLLKVYFEKRLAPLDAAEKCRRISDFAFAQGCSVYQLFQQAGTKWNFSQKKIEEDFTLYVKGDELPHYVSDYMDRHPLTADQTYQKLLFSGGRPPYL